MNKIFVVLLAGLGVYALQVQADDMADNSNMTAVTISEAMQMPDDSNVMIIGTITENLGNEKYKLKDNSGEVIVEIDNDDWVGVAATPGSTVQIMGEIDRNGNENIEIDVESATVQQ